MHMVMSVYLKHVPSCIIWIIIEILKQKMEFYIMIKNCELNGLQKNQFYQLEINKVNLLIILKKELYLYNLFKYLIKFFIKAFASIKLIKKIF